MQRGIFWFTIWAYKICGFLRKVQSAILGVPLLASLRSKIAVHWRIAALRPGGRHDEEGLAGMKFRLGFWMTVCSFKYAYWVKVYAYIFTAPYKGIKQRIYVLWEGKFFRICCTIRPGFGFGFSHRGLRFNAHWILHMSSQLNSCFKGDVRYIPSTCCVAAKKRCSEMSSFWLCRSKCLYLSYNWIIYVCYMLYYVFPCHNLLCKTVKLCPFWVVSVVKLIRSFFELAGFRRFF